MNPWSILVLRYAFVVPDSPHPRETTSRCWTFFAGTRTRSRRRSGVTTTFCITGIWNTRWRCDTSSPRWRTARIWRGRAAERAPTDWGRPSSRASTIISPNCRGTRLTSRWASSPPLLFFFSRSISGEKIEPSPNSRVSRTRFYSWNKSCC